jgi:acetyl-CoA carboxylase/biotin carboxylase 1
MEAKGCAKPTVWKNARRHFYWALRARLAQSAAVDAVAAASPETSLDYQSTLVNKLAGLADDADDRTAAAAFEALDLTDTLAGLRAAALTAELAQRTAADRKSTVDGLVRFIDGLSDEEKMAIRTALQAAARSSGMRPH